MAELQTKRYPIRGALWGLLLGLAVAYFLFFELAVFGFDSLSGVITKFALVAGVAMVVGVLWSFVAPARKPKQAPPVAAAPPAAPPAAAMHEAPPPAPAGEAPPPVPDDEEPPPEPTP